MSYKIEQLNNNSLLIQAGEVITIEEWVAMNEEILTYTQGASGTFNIITDMLLTTEHPDDAKAFHQSMDWAGDMNIGWVIYLTRNPELSAKIDTAMTSRDQTYMVLDSLKSAMSIVALPAA